MNQSPNPPAGGTPQQPGGWSPQPGGSSDWQSDPTQQLPSSQPYPPTSQYPAQGPAGQYPPPQNPTGPYPPQQYPPTQQLPAQGGTPAGGYGQPQSAGYPGNPPYGPGTSGDAPPAGGGNAAPGYGQGAPGYGATPNGPGPGAPGYNAAGQYGPPGASYGPPGGSFGAPPNGGGGYGGPPPPGGRGRNPLPLIIGIVAGVLVLGLAAWYFLRPGSPTASPSTGVPSSSQPSPSATPSVLVTPSASPPTSTPSVPPSPRPSGTTAASCAAELSKIQCDWAVYLRKFVQVNTCQTDSSDMRRDAVRCTANARGKLKGNATVTMRWADDSKDLTGLMDSFFARAGVSKSKIGKNWKKPPAHTNWWYTNTPKKVEGKLGSASAGDGSGRVAWTFTKQRFFIEAISDTDNVKVMIDWWART